MGAQRTREQQQQHHRQQQQQHQQQQQQQQGSMKGHPPPLVLCPMSMTIPFLLLLLLCPLSASAKPSPGPRLFLLGGSLLDTGNTNFLASAPKDQLFSNFTPYGQLFSPAGPNGRFSDGKILTDFLAEKMKIDVPSSFLDPKKDSATGINFATFGALLSVSPSYKRSLTFMNMDQQLQLLNASVQGGLVPSPADVVAFSCGAEDLLLWMESAPPLTIAFGSSSVAASIALNYISFVTRVYSLGFKNILVSNAPQVGCLPIVRSIASRMGFGTACNPYANNPAKNFNSQLKHSLDALRQSTFQDGNVLLLDLFTAQGDAISSAPAGNVDGPACCGGPPPLNADVQCGKATATLCSNSTKYTYWDLIHPSQAILKRAFDSSWNSPNYVTPITVEQLLQNLGVL